MISKAVKSVVLKSGKFKPTMKYTILLLALLILPATTRAASPDNYCHDKEAATHWDALVKKNPQDLDFQRLHALRLGFRLKVEKRQIQFLRGISDF